LCLKTSLSRASQTSDRTLGGHFGIGVYYEAPISDNHIISPTHDIYGVSLGEYMRFEMSEFWLNYKHFFKFGNSSWNTGIGVAKGTVDFYDDSKQSYENTKNTTNTNFDYTIYRFFTGIRGNW
jgi:hypothetical protein